VGERDIERWFDDQQARRANRREACASKRHFVSEAEARAAALWQRTQFGERLTSYRCAECNEWHLTRGRGRGPD
jgi:hypothetical protein